VQSMKCKGDISKRHYCCVCVFFFFKQKTAYEMDMMEMGGGQLMAMLPQWSPRYAGLIFVMWVVMMAAMMLPSAAPTILLVGALFRNRGGAVRGRTALFASGFLLVWCGFSAAATLLQWGLGEAGLLS